MKSKIYSHLLLMGLTVISGLSILLNGCQKSGAKNSDDSPSTIVLTQQTTMSDGVAFPIGTTISKIPEDPHSLRVDLPKGYSFVGYAINTNASGIATAEVISVTDTKLTCTCTQGTGCSPFMTTIGQSGCSLSDKCTKCTAERSNAAVMGQKIINGSVVHSVEQTHFVTTKSELKSLRSAYTAMFSLPAVQAEVTKLLGFIDNKDNDQIKAGQIPRGYQYLPAAVFGRLVLVLVKKDMTEASSPALNENAINNFAAASGITCTCNSGKTGCVAGSAMFGKVKYCTAGDCTSCTLETN